MTDDVMRALGRIEGTLESIVAQNQEQNTKLAELDGRVRKLEVRAAAIGGVSGSVSGAVVALGVQLADAILKVKGGG